MKWQMQRPGPDDPGRPQVLAGLGVLVLGLSLMLAWHLGWLGWLDFGSGGGYARYAAALGLAGLGAGACSPRFGKFRVGLVFGTSFLGFLGLVMDGVAPTWILERHIWPEGVEGIRGVAFMPPITAVMLVVGSLGLASRNPQAPLLIPPLLGAVGFLFAFLASASSLVRLLGGEASSWGLPEGLVLALPMALGFGLLGIGFISEAMRRDPERFGVRGVPVALALIGLGLALLLFQATRMQRAQAIERACQAELDSVRERLQRDLDRSLTDLDRMARIWALDPPTQPLWTEQAGALLHQEQGLACLGWVSTGRTLRWMEAGVPFGSETLALAAVAGDLPGTAKEALAELLGRVERVRRSQVSRPFCWSPERGWCLLLAAPIPRPGDRGGHLLGILLLRPWAVQTLSEARHWGFGLGLSLDHQQEFLRLGAESPGEAWRSASLPLDPQPWILRLAPGPEVLAQHRNQVGVAILAGGCLVFLVSGALAVAAGRAWRNAVGWRESLERFRSLVANLQAGILVVGEDGQVELCNEAFLGLFGIQATAKDLVGRNPSELLGYMAFPYLGAWLEGVREAGRDRKDTALLDQEVGLVDGRAVQRDCIPIRVGEQVRGHLWVFREITERKRMERLKDEFVATVSHELRTPLTAIRGALGLLRGGVAGKVEGHGRELLEIGQRNTDRLLLLINDLLDVQKMEAGKLEYAFVQKDLSVLVLEALDTMGPLAERQGVHFKLEPSQPESCPVRADGGRITQVLVNLLGNAVKFSPNGATVQVRILPREGAVRLEVQDEGPGVPPDFVPRLFEKFSQATSGSARHPGGTGLGLSIARAIVRAHGGEIAYRPGEPKGSCFYFELPGE